MPIVMGPNTYGKAEVRVVKVIRDGDRDDLRDLTVAVQLEGDFDDVYVHGDNRTVLPTDTMMRTIYALASDDPLRSIEEFGLRLVDHFLEATPAATVVRVEVVQHPWERLHPHAFLRGSGQRTAQVTGTRARPSVQAGIADLFVLKTADSAFTGYLKDSYTFLPETEDRILATVVSADWSYASPDLDYNATWQGVRQTLLDTFAEHHSQSVQHTIWILGRAVLEAFDSIERIHLALPNRHHLLVDLTPYGRENDREVFHATDRPYGMIEATVRRG
jgi:urate oxidase